MRILPFTVGDLELVHTEGDNRLDRQARDFWRVLSDKALLKYRDQNDTEWCIDAEDFPGGGQSLTICFAVFDVDRRGNRGAFVGTFALYKVQGIERRPTGIVTALFAPMLPEVLEEGNSLSRLVAINDWFLDHELETDDPRTRIRVVRRRRSTDAGEAGPQSKRDQGSWTVGRGLRIPAGMNLEQTARRAGVNTTRPDPRP